MLQTWADAEARFERAVSSIHVKSLSTYESGLETLPVILASGEVFSIKRALTYWNASLEISEWVVSPARSFMCAPRRPRC